MFYTSFYFRFFLLVSNFCWVFGPLNSYLNETICEGLGGKSLFGGTANNKLRHLTHDKGPRLFCMGQKKETLVQS